MSQVTKATLAAVPAARFHRSRAYRSRMRPISIS